MHSSEASASSRLRKRLRAGQPRGVRAVEDVFGRGQDRRTAGWASQVREFHRMGFWEQPRVPGPVILIPNRASHVQASPYTHVHAPQLCNPHSSPTRPILQINKQKQRGEVAGPGPSSRQGQLPRKQTQARDSAFTHMPYPTVAWSPGTGMCPPPP